MKFNVFFNSLILLATFSLAVHADYAPVINDSNPMKDGSNFYQLFNNYFANELSAVYGDGFEYTSSMDLFEERGVQEVIPTWTVGEGGRIQASFKNAALDHDLNLYDANGNYVDSVYFKADTTSTSIENVNPIYLQEGSYSFVLDAYAQTNPWLSYIEGVFYSDDPANNIDGMIHMIAFDVTDLARLMFSDDSITSAYLFGWEDVSAFFNADFDYQDLAVMMINVIPNAPSATPEPATALILGIGLIGGAFARKRFRKNR